MIAHVVEKIAQMVAVAVAILFDDQALPHVVRHARAGPSVKGDGLALARLRPVDRERSEAADAAVQRVEHALSKGRGDRRVDGVAALLQDGRADVHRRGLRSNDHARHG
jgi:hypothetical protein